MKNWQAVCVILLCFTTYTSSAQSRLRLGPEVALAINFSPKTDFVSSVLLSGHFGMKTTYALKNHFSISTGIYFSQKKIQYKSSYTEPTPSLNSLLNILSSTQNLPFDPNKAFNTDSKITINGLAAAQFIEIPVLCSYEHKGIVFSAGPYLGILASIRDKQIKETSIPFVQTLNYSEIAGGTGGAILSFLSPPAYSKTETTNKSTSSFKKIDFGFILGLGYQFKNVNINGSFSYGLLDYRENTRSSDKRISYKTLRLSLVYMFELQRKKSKGVPQSSGENM